MASAAAMNCPPKIMQRPSAAIVGKKEKATPASFQNNNSTMLLDKEEKKDDRAPVVMMRPEGQPVSIPSNENNNVNVAIIAASSSRRGWNPLDEIDSALLSALCDARERKALFRLEQVMQDFMKDNSSASMEVGGAFNSIVLKQDSSSKSLGANSSNSGEASDGQTPANTQGLQDLQYQQQRGLRQTSFQRLILHRLADRFNIVREQITNTTISNINGNERGLVDVGGQQHPSSFSPGLIRLVKTPGSGIPSHLLIDVDLSLLVNYKNPRARSYQNYGGGGNGNINNNAVISSPNNMINNNSGGHEDGTMKNLAQNMASTTLESPPAGERTSSSSTSAKKSSKKKMVIMKRNTSSSSGSNPEGKGKAKGKTRRKKLEDREKAYEEARARIFGISESSGNETNTSNGGGSDNGDSNADKGERSVPQSATEAQEVAGAALNTPMGSCHSSFSVENERSSPISAAEAASGSAGGERMVPSQLISAVSPPANRASPSTLPQQPQDQEPPASSPRETAEANNTSRQSSFSGSNASVPAAVTSGGVSKAVYRNRQQEENDPDFKRRSDVRPAYVPYYGPPAGANPYAAGPMGGQPPPPVPTPQMMAAMHAQQAAAMGGQQAPPHFYQGQTHPSAGHSFPTPQDANFSGNVPGNNAPPQWVSPPRGYYPPPQQQGQPQGQMQEQKHPQAWQPQGQRQNSNGPIQPQRSNSSGQMQQQQQQLNIGGQFNAPATMKTSQPKQPTVLWGPGAAARGDSNVSDARAMSTSALPVAEGVPRTVGLGKTGTAVYKPEDFPALG